MLKKAKSPKGIVKLSENAANDAFKKLGHGIQFSIWDLGKILDAGRNAFINSVAMGESLDVASGHCNAAVAAAIKENARK